MTTTSFWEGLCVVYCLQWAFALSELEGATLTAPGTTCWACMMVAVGDVGKKLAIWTSDVMAWLGLKAAAYAQLWQAQA
jgi:hypothetical protein